MNAAGAAHPASPPVEEQPPRRVREDARDGLAVIAFSAAVSVALTLLFLVLAALAS